MRLRSIGLVLAGLAAVDAEAGAIAGRIIAGADEGGAPQVVVRDGDTPSMSFLAYDPLFTGGVRVATGDVNGDGTADLVTGAGPAGGTHLEVFDGVSGSPLWNFFAYTPSFTGGIYVAAGDVNGDGHADVITGVGAGGSPHVKVFDGQTQAPIASFFAFDVGFQGGVRVAAGDVNGDGLADLVLGTGPGAGTLKILSGADLASLGEYQPYGSSYNGGVFVAAGDVDGDGLAEQLVGPDENPNAGPRVRVFDGATGAQVADFDAFDPGFHGGVRVAAGDVDGDTLADLVLSAGPGGAPTVRRLSGIDQHDLGGFDAFGPSFTGGVYVGAAAIPTPEADAAGVAALLGLALRKMRRASRSQPPH